MQLHNKQIRNILYFIMKYRIYTIKNRSFVNKQVRYIKVSSEYAIKIIKE